MTSSPSITAERGERIYQTKYKTQFEQKHLGRFVAIDVETEAAYLGATPESALEQGRTASPHGIFHLIRIGSPGVFRLGYIGASDGDWVFGR